MMKVIKLKTNPINIKVMNKMPILFLIKNMMYLLKIVLRKLLDSKWKDIRGSKKLKILKIISLILYLGHGTLQLNLRWIITTIIKYLGYCPLKFKI